MPRASRVVPSGLERVAFAFLVCCERGHLPRDFRVNCIHPRLLLSVKLAEFGVRLLQHLPSLDLLGFPSFAFDQALRHLPADLEGTHILFPSLLEPCPDGQD